MCLPFGLFFSLHKLCYRMSTFKKKRSYCDFYSGYLTQEVPQSPFSVKVDPSHDASKVKAEGPGLARTGERVDLMGH